MSFRTLRRFALVQIAGISLLSPFVPLTALAQDASPLPDHVSRLETVIFGSANTGQPLTDRIDHLETTVMGKPQSGGLDTRIRGLEKVTFSAGSTLAAADPSSQPASSPVSDAGSNPGSTHTLLQSGIVAVQQGDEMKAKQMFNDVIRIDPHNPDAFFNLGALAERDGNLTEAMSDYQQVETFRPGDADAQQAIRSVAQRLAFNHSVPAPFQQNKPFDLNASQNATTQISVAPPMAALGTVTLPKHKTKGFLHKLGQVAKVSAVAAAVVIQNSSVQYGAPYHDTCGCVWRR